MSTPIGTMDPDIQAILLGPEVIAVQQDYAGQKGQPVSSPLSKSGLVWAKPLSGRNGSAAFLLNTFNQGDPHNVTVFFADLGYDASAKALVRDLVARKDLGSFTGSYTALLGASESRLLRVRPAA